MGLERPDEFDSGINSPIPVVKRAISQVNSFVQRLMIFEIDGFRIQDTVIIPEQ